LLVITSVLCFLLIEAHPAILELLKPERVAYYALKARSVTDDQLVFVKRKRKYDWLNDWLGVGQGRPVRAVYLAAVCRSILSALAMPYGVSPLAANDDLLPHPGVNHWTANPKSSCILTQNTNSLKLYWHLFVVHFIAKNLANSFEFDITRPIELYANNYNKPLTPPFSG
jgi:hypothetical protein